MGPGTSLIVPSDPVYTDYGEWTLKNFYIGDKLSPYLGDSIDLTGDLVNWVNIDAVESPPLSSVVASTEKVPVLACLP
jgi:hypothetical protein